MKKVIFRADGNHAIGLGHVMRCLAFAGLLKDEFSCSFLIQAPSESLKKQIARVCSRLTELPPDLPPEEEALWIRQHCLKGDEIIITDGYGFDTRYQEILKSGGSRLVCIDDIHRFHFVADALINHAPGVSRELYSTEPSTRCCFGTDYLLLRPRFRDLAAQKQRPGADIRNVFVCFGGSDFQELSLKAVTAALQVSGIKQVHAAVGSAYSDTLRNAITNLRETASGRLFIHSSLDEEAMIQVMRQCGMGIAPASTVSLEICCARMALLSGFYTDNQLLIYEGLKKEKCIVPVGDFTALTAEQLSGFISSTLYSPLLAEEILRNQERLFTGNSAETLKQLIHSLC
jgi:UDP-2,4-diacetamido-2,4,6-trideoxy-beta-L-altropyranose hydrolase